MHSEGNLIFVGIKISEKLQEQLDASKDSVKPYFGDNNPEFLQITRIDNEEYIGKEIMSGSSLEKLSNIQKNVKTMLGMICPRFQFTDSSIVIMAIHSISRSTFY